MERDIHFATQIKLLIGHLFIFAQTLALLHTNINLIRLPIVLS